MNYDAQMQADVDRNPKAVVGWLVCASYAYYCRDESLLSDSMYDRSCQWLLENYDAVDHRLKHMLPREALVAGSAYHLAETDYPYGLRWLVEQRINELEARRLAAQFERNWEP